MKKLTSKTVYTGKEFLAEVEEIKTISETNYVSFVNIEVQKDRIIFYVQPVLLMREDKYHEIILKK